MRKFVEVVERNFLFLLNELIFENEIKEKVDLSEEQIDFKEFIEKMNNLFEDVFQVVRRGIELVWKII